MILTCVLQRQGLCMWVRVFQDKCHGRAILKNIVRPSFQKSFEFIIYVSVSSLLKKNSLFHTADNFPIKFVKRQITVLGLYYQPEFMCHTLPGQSRDSYNNQF